MTSRRAISMIVTTAWHAITTWQPRPLQTEPDTYDACSRLAHPATADESEKSFTERRPAGIDASMRRDGESVASTAVGQLLA